ncbi:MAG: AtpZ/AtpI family protein [Paracoccaceae bacterium]|nr:AtpZ/AtpI family protein [Paracoccaceae bacterium]
MTGPDDAERLRDLDERIKALKGAASEEKPHQKEHYSMAQQGWRMVVDLVAGMAVGFVIGYGLDTLLGTLPIMLVIFTLLGFAAGVRAMLATARDIQSGQTGDDPEAKG